MNDQDLRDDLGREEVIFNAAVRLRDLTKRAVYLDWACEEDAALRARVERLLANDAGDTFFTRPVSQPVGVGSAAGARPIPSPGTLDAQALGERIGRYRLLQKIGEGGLGVVYMAEQEEPVRRRVALKVIRLGMDTESVIARFEAERQALAMMDHPNIAKILDGGVTETGRPYFVMDLVQGLPIIEFCDEARLSTRDRLDLFRDVCSAIQHAHQKGIIHRDIKPSNILVTLHGEKPVPKVIDFGIAKATQQRLTDKTLLTQFQQFIGTPAYVSPEQASLSGLDVDTRSDIYSLGVLLYELLTGKTPFDSKELLAAGLDEMRRTIREKEPLLPSTRLSALGGQELRTAAKRRGLEPPKLISTLRGELDWIVMKCLEKDRARRYETANGLATDIQRHLKNELVLASPPSVIYRTQKFIRRYRVIVSVTLAVGMILLGATLVSSSLAVRASRAEQQQTRLREDALRAQGNEALQRSKAEQRLYDSLLGEARALRIARRVGYRAKAFEALKQAVALQMPRKDVTEIRQEAVACMGDLVGLTPVTFEDFPKTTMIREARLERSGQTAAFAFRDGGIVLRQVPSGRELGRLKGDNPVFSICFNSVGNQLVSIHYLPRPLSVEARVAASRVYTWGCGTDGQWSQADELSLPGAWECWPCGEDVFIIVFSFHPRTGRVVRLKDRAVILEFEFPDWGTGNGEPATGLSPDGRFLASETQSMPGAHDHEIDLWDLKTGQRVKRLEPHLGDFSTLTFSPDEKYLCCLSEHEGGVVYSMEGFRPVAEFAGKFEWMSQPGFAAGANILALPLRQQNRVRIWDLIKHQEAMVLDEPDYIFEACFSADEMTLMSYGKSYARFYRLNLPEKLRLAGHAGFASATTFEPGGKRLASVGTDRRVRVWDCGTGRQAWESEPLPGSGQSVAYSPDGQVLVAGDSDTKWISVWEAATGKPLQGLGMTNEGWNWSVQFSPDGHYLATAGGGYGYQDELALWTLEADSAAPRRKFNAHNLARLSINSWSLVVSPDSRHLAFADNPGVDPISRITVSHLYVLDLNTRREPRLITTNFIASAQCVNFTPDSKGLLFADSNRAITTMDIATGRELSSFPTTDFTQVHAWADFPNLCLAPDGKRLAMASASSRTVDIWDTTTGKLTFSLPEQSSAVSWLSWSPNGDRLAISRADGDIAVWNLAEIEKNLIKVGLDQP